MKFSTILSFVIGITSFLTADSHLLADPPSKKYQLSICALFKNEEKFLREWLEYHLLVGVDHFYLYNIGSQDRFQAVIDPYIRKGVVTLINWPSFFDLENQPETSIALLSTQVAAYENVTKVVALHTTKWLMLSNVNEFIVPDGCNKITEVLDKYVDSVGVMIPMNFYDASKDSLPFRKVLIETNERLVPSKQVFKTIVQPEFCEGFDWPPYKQLFVNDAKVVQLEKTELCLNRYLKRNTEENIYTADSIFLTENMLEGFAKEGDHIEGHENAIHRFIPSLMKKLGFEIWHFPSMGRL